MPAAEASPIASERTDDCNTPRRGACRRRACGHRLPRAERPHQPHGPREHPDPHYRGGDQDGLPARCRSLRAAVRPLEPRRNSGAGAEQPGLCADHRRRSRDAGRRGHRRHRGRHRVSARKIRGPGARAGGTAGGRAAADQRLRRTRSGSRAGPTTPGAAGADQPGSARQCRCDAGQHAGHGAGGGPLGRSGAPGNWLCRRPFKRDAAQQPARRLRCRDGPARADGGRPGAADRLPARRRPRGSAATTGRSAARHGPGVRQ